MNKFLTTLTAGLALLTVSAQENTNSFVRGTLDIKYNTRTQIEDGKPKRGVSDVYTLDVNVANSAIFKGIINHTPFIDGGTFSANQNSSLNFVMDTAVVNPRNPSQTKNVGRIFGVVPVDQNNVYRFQDGNLRVLVNPVGTVARGFESKFNGYALGKPPVKSLGLIDTIKKEAVNVQKQIQGKTVSIVIKKYDKMEFKNHILAAGPVQIYPDVTVNGVLLYDYDKTAWFFNNVQVSYASDGQQKVDKLSGSIRWIEASNRKTTGEGEYQFDVRVNEPLSNESSIFAKPADEAAFFETDTTIPALVGTMKYKDVVQGDSVVSSNVKIDLNGNMLNKQQVMYLTKLIVFSCVVPFNAE